MASWRPLVSVYILNHNYARFLERAIESVLHQTLQDFELIIIDDGSTDESREIIERYAQHEKVLTIFQQNKGLNVTNNIALRAAIGKYVVRVDADDYLDENALFILSGTLDRDPDLSLVFPDYFVVDENDAVLEVVRREESDNVALFDRPAHGACTMIRRELLESLGGYDESFDRQDGWDIWIRLIGDHRVKNVNLPLFYYRQHGNNLTRDEASLLATRSEILHKHVAGRARIANAVAVVAVRGHTTDPHTMALRELGSKRLIDWTIEAALGARRIADVVVTSPDQEILSHVRARYGTAVYRIERDVGLAQLNTSSDDAVAHAIANMRERAQRYDAIVRLFVESPFRSARYIDMAVNVLDLFATDTVVAVRPELDIFMQHDGTGLTPLRKSDTLRLERDELYRQVGDLAGASRGHFEMSGRTTGGRCGHVVLDRRAALRLETEWEWSVAEGEAAKIERETADACAEIDQLSSRGLPSRGAQTP